MKGNTRVAVAIHIMTSLAFARQSMTSAELARSIGTNAVVVRRLLSLLGQAGLITCSSGKSGGSRLARAAREISIADIYDAVTEQPSPFAIPQKSPNRGCPVSCQMKKLLKQVFEEAEDSMRARFSRTTLFEITNRIERTT